MLNLNKTNMSKQTYSIYWRTSFRRPGTNSGFLCPPQQRMTRSFFLVCILIRWIGMFFERRQYNRIVHWSVLYGPALGHPRTLAFDSFSKNISQFTSDGVLAKHHLTPVSHLRKCRRIVVTFIRPNRTVHNTKYKILDHFMPIVKYDLLYQLSFSHRMRTYKL